MQSPADKQREPPTVRRAREGGDPREDYAAIPDLRRRVLEGKLPRIGRNFIGHLGRSLRQSRLAPVLEPSMWRAFSVSFCLVFGSMVLWAAWETVVSSGCGGARIQRPEADFRAIKAALIAYKIKADHYPSMEQGLAALSEIPQTEPLPKEWTKITDGIPIDPWGNEYRYRLHEGVTVRETEV